MISPSIILAVETAVGGGSISVLRSQGTVLGQLADVSRAEDLLTEIARLLADCKVSRNQIEMIAVSLGPGSFTGIRIGIATALGLTSSLGAKCVGVNALEAVSMSCPNESATAVLPVGRGYFAFQDFRHAEPAGRPEVVNEEELIQALKSRSDVSIVFGSEPGFASAQLKLPESFVVTERLSTLIGRCAVMGGGTKEMKPLYFRYQGVRRTSSDRGSG